MTAIDRAYYQSWTRLTKQSKGWYQRNLEALQMVKDANWILSRLMVEGSTEHMIYIFENYKLEYAIKQTSKTIEDIEKLEILNDPSIIHEATKDSKERYSSIISTFEGIPFT